MTIFNKKLIKERSAKKIQIVKSRNSRLEKSIIVESLLSSYSMEYNPNKKFDIFLSHSYNDKEDIIGIKDILEKDFLYSVYVDWIEDLDLNREKITKQTALRIKKRMENCKCLFYASSTNTETSKWMPWETGLMDGMKNRVAILPYLDNPTGDEFNGQQYLKIYPYVTEGIAQNQTENTLWIHDDKNTYVDFDSWLQGNEPIYHK